MGAELIETAPPPTASRFRIRWGWFIGCIVLGLAAILIGWFVARDLGYFASVLANVGTTLLLVGIVVLLERRIVDNAVRAVRRANAQTTEALRVQIHDLENRLALVWESATADDVSKAKAEMMRLTDEFTKRIVDEATGEE